MKERFVGGHVDFIGFVASLLCAVHCAGLPLILSFAPLMGLGFLSNPWVEYSMIFMSLLIASYALIVSYRQCHHKPLALIIVCTGFVLISLGHVFSIEWAEIVLTSCGATAVASAHFINWKHVRNELLQQVMGVDDNSLY